LIDVVLFGARSVRGLAMGVAIALAVAAGGCSNGSNSSDGAPRDAGREGTADVADAGDVHASAGDAQPTDASGGQPNDAADASDGRPDASTTADAPLDLADAVTGADLRSDGATDAPADTHADMASNIDATADTPADMASNIDATADIASNLDAPADTPADMASNIDATGDTPPLRGCASPGNILCETFEATLAGRLPTASPWLDRPVSGICDSNSTLAVNGTQVHDGARALTSHSFSNQCVLEADLGVHPELWVRVWVRSDVPGPGEVDVSEMTLFGIGANQFGDDPRIAVGYSGTIAFSPCSQLPGISVNTTGSSPAAGCTGAALPTGRWQCFELHVTQAGAMVRAELYIDGQQQTFALPGSDAGSITTVANMYGATVRYLVLGVRQYGSRYVTPAYYDDVAAGTERMGCSN
jgi:hypothetical protein